MDIGKDNGSTKAEHIAHIGGIQSPAMAAFERAGEAMHDWRPVDLSDEKYAKPSEPPCIGGIIYAGKRIAFTGAPESLKTLIAHIVGLEWMRAGLGRYAVIDFEMAAEATRLMFVELGATVAELRDIYYVNPDGPPTDRDIANMLAVGVTLATVDAAAGAFDASGLDDNKRADVEKFAGKWIRPLWRQGCTTITLDHVTKNAETRGKFAIGSERKLGGVDVQLGFEAITQLHRGGTGLVRITTQKDRPGHLGRPYAAELRLTSDPDTHAITHAWTEPEPQAAAAPNTEKLPPATVKILDALRGRDGSPATIKDLTDDVAARHGHGLMRSTVSKALNTLGRLGYAHGYEDEASASDEKLWVIAVPGVPGVSAHVPAHEATPGVPGVPPSIGRHTGTAHLRAVAHPDEDEVDF